MNSGLTFKLSHENFTQLKQILMIIFSILRPRPKADMCKVFSLILSQLNTLIHLRVLKCKNETMELDVLPLAQFEHLYMFLIQPASHFFKKKRLRLACFRSSVKLEKCTATNTHDLFSQVNVYVPQTTLTKIHETSIITKKKEQTNKHTPTHKKRTYTMK